MQSSKYIPMSNGDSLEISISSLYSYILIRYSGVVFLGGPAFGAFGGCFESIKARWLKSKVKKECFLLTTGKVFGACDVFSGSGKRSQQN